jgi:hypothetical protein
LSKFGSQYFYNMRLHYLVIFVLYLFAAYASGSETGKKGPKVTDKVSLILLQLYSWYIRTTVIPLKS